VFAWSSLARGFFSGRVTREAFAANPEILDGAARKAYAHETNFRRLDRARELAKEKGLAVPQIALAYVLGSRMNVYPIVGAASREEFAANVEASAVKLSDAEMKWLNLESDTR
jgi:aryl-alcohol dehydrogenase-like predicted oxidoreductase